MNINFNSEGVAVLKKGRRIVAKVFNRPIFWKVNNLHRYSYDPKYPFSLEISGMSRECESIEDVKAMIDKYC